MYNTIIEKFVDGDSSSFIKIMGVGGGGCNAVENLYKRGLGGVTYAVCNTDAVSLNECQVPTRVAIGALGAGDDPVQGRKAALEHEEKIRKTLNDGTLMLFITAGMGGGTGTGAAPEVARIAHEMGILTVGIVTIPFAFEGMQKILKALQWIMKMAEYADAMIVVNNEKLTRLPGYTILDTFHVADEVLANAAESIANLVLLKGYIHVDFADVSNTLRSGKMAVISTGEGEGEGRVTKALGNAVESMLLDNKEMYKCKRLVLNFYCSQSNAIVSDEINEISAFTRKLVEDVGVKWGINFDESLGSKVKVTVLAAGYGEICPKEYLEQYKRLGIKNSVRECALSSLDDDDELLAEMTEAKAVNR